MGLFTVAFHMFEIKMFGSIAVCRLFIINELIRLGLLTIMRPACRRSLTSYEEQDHDRVVPSGGRLQSHVVWNC